MRPGATYFIASLFQTPGDFTRQEKTALGQDGLLAKLINIAWFLFEN